MAKRELEHFTVDGSYGGNQTWFRTFMMRLGGCGAETACDLSVYLALHRGAAAVCPFDPHDFSRADYVDFAHVMEKYLWPRRTGIDKLSIFVDGYEKYLRDRGVTADTADGASGGGIIAVRLDTLDGTEPYEKAAEALIRQIDAGFPVPTLILNHKNKKYKDYVWHWFLINGYEEREGTLMVKAVTYSNYEWMDLKQLWDTGYERRGGFVLVQIESDPVIPAAIAYITDLFRGNSGGHDAAHTLRVYRNALMIAAGDPECDVKIAALAALLHDADDHKLFGTQNNANARRFLAEQGVPAQMTERIIEAVNSVSFSQNRGRVPETPEGRAVQDADRLDGIGAVGIARTFAYGGEHGRPMEESVQHFHDKLLRLKGMMNTPAGQFMAADRHAFLEEFLRRYEEETGQKEP